MDVPGFLLGHREKGHLYSSKKHFQICVWRELQRLVWKLRSLVFIYLGTMHKLFWVLWSAGLVLSEPPCFGGCSDTLPAFSLLKSSPNTRILSTAWSHILSFYLFVVKWSSREVFWGTLLIHFLLSFLLSFYSWSKVNNSASENSFLCVTKKLAGGSWQFIGIQEEVDFLLYKHLRIRL